MEYIIIEKFIIRTILSIICGILLGYERELRGKSAGIKTHMLVCVGACVAVFLATLIEQNECITALGRTVAAIIQGIGFLGTGMIITRDDRTYGLTSAAAIWLTSIVGMICGSNYYYLVFIFAVIYCIAIKISFYIEDRMKGRANVKS